MNDKNPLKIKTKETLKTGRRLGDHKDKIEYKQISTYIKKSNYQKILKAVKKDGSLSLKKIINTCLDKYLDEELLNLTKEEKYENRKSS